VPISGKPEIGVSLRSPGTRGRCARPGHARLRWAASTCPTHLPSCRDPAL